MAILKRLGQTAKELRLLGGLLRKRPFSVLVQVTNRCNMRCGFCDFWPNGVPPKQELKVADYQRISAELAQIGCFMVSIEGGEPMLRPDLAEIVAAFAEHHFTALYTNGRLVTPAKAQSLFAAGLKQAAVSIDFPDAARHDARRRLDGAFESAWAAVDALRAAAPHGGRQVQVMSIVMQENLNDLETLLQMSAAREVGHSLTLLATGGFRRGHCDDVSLPGTQRSLSSHLLDLWQRYPHLQAFRDYLTKMDDFLGQSNLPQCHAGEQSFNIDHLGNLSPCIERIHQSVGNLREASVAQLLPKLRGVSEVAQCQQCWTLCRGYAHSLGEGASPRALVDLASRVRVP